MRLGDLWAKHGVGTLQPNSAATKDLFIFGVTDDSRDVRHGYLFCALPGTKEDGLAFCAQAAAKGAQAIAVAEGIRLGIGDVTEPLAPAVIQAMHAAVDELAGRSSFRGYGPEQGYDFLRVAIAKHD